MGRESSRKGGGGCSQFDLGSSLRACGVSDVTGRFIDLTVVQLYASMLASICLTVSVVT